MQFVTKSLVRFGVVTLLSLFVFGCGSSNDNNNTPPTGETKPPVIDDGGGTPVSIKTGMHVITSLCDIPNGCPDNKVPYRVVMEVEWEAPAGWIKIGEFDSGALGDITVGVPAGKYRLTKKAAQPSTSGKSATSPSQTITVILDNLTEATFLFTPN